MSKQNDINYGRNQGLAFALSIVRSGGIEALEKEVQDRGITGVSLNVTHKEIQEASWKVNVRATEVAIAISLITLMGDEFCFSRSQLTKFKKAFDAKVYKTANSDRSMDILQEYTDKIREYAGVEINIRD